MSDLLQPHPPSGWHERVASLRQSLPTSTLGAVGGLVALAAVAAAVAVAAVLLLRAPPPAPELTLPRAVEAPAGPAGGAPGSVGTGVGGLATVHAAGQVAHPGVYTVPAGARVADVLTAAGGPLSDADLAQVNLAAKVADGERVSVPKQGETPVVPPAGTGGAGASGAKPAPGPLDLNTATAEQLDELPGVGPATAQAILTWRTRNGRFRTVADLLEVPGIGPAKMEILRPLVRV